MNGPRVLLAGMARSGTTWAAAALGAALGCPQRMEPFHPDKDPDGHAVASWRYRTVDDGDPEFDRVVQHAFAETPVVVKDVHGLLAIERTAAVAGAGVVLLTRHPVAVAASWQRVGWLTDDLAGPCLEKLAAQPALLDAHLADYEAALMPTEDPLHNVGTLWAAVQRVWDDQVRAHPDWTMIRHEDLCAAPKAGFTRLLDGLGASISEVGDVVLDQFLDHFDEEPGPDHDPFSISRRTAAEPAKAESALDPANARRVLAAVEAFDVSAPTTA